MGAVMVRRRTGLSQDACVLVATRGEFAGLRLPGPASTGTRWHARLDVVLLLGELRIAANGGIWRYRVADMVLASPDPVSSGGIRVDFLDGDPLVVSVKRRARLLDGLRRQIHGHERSLRSDRQVVPALVGDRLTVAELEASHAALTPAICLLNRRQAGPTGLRGTDGGGGPDGSDRDVPTAVDRTAIVDEALHCLRVEALRTARRDLVCADRVPA